MNKPILTLLITGAAALVLAAGCSNHQNADDSHANHPAMQQDMEGMQHNMVATDANAKNAKPYPLDTCIVSGEKLGSMGEPVRMVYQGQEFQFCCKDCMKDFHANPDKFVAALAQKTATGGK